MGQHDDVAAVGLIGGRAHALGTEALELRLDSAVLLGDDVPARLPVRDDLAVVNDDDVVGERPSAFMGAQLLLPGQQ
jgi:hypothetical protein